MEYQGVASQSYYNYPEVQLANASYGSNNYFPSDINSHVGVASYDDTRYVASADTFDGYYGQEQMSTVNSLSFDDASNIKHANLYSSAISSQYGAPSQDMPMNETIRYSSANYLASCSPNSASYIGANAHDSASCVTNNHS